MSGPWIPPVVATVTGAGLVVSAVRRVTPELRRLVTDAVADHCDGRAAVLTDGATSALAQALRVVRGANRCVALPGFGCVDLVAAALFAGVSVVTYDLDPSTLTPDLDSVQRAILAGVDAVVIAPLLGFPIDFDAVCGIARHAGIPVIEDAAQGAGGSWHGSRIGTFGDLVVLSFGRGKGMSAGRGGALVSRHPSYDSAIRDVAGTMPPPAAGWRDLLVSAAVWALARPGLYAVPSSIPALRLGEMVFHAAHAPTAMADRAVAMVPDALCGAGAAAAARGAVARRLRATLAETTGAAMPSPLPDGTSGWLRLPLLDHAGRGAVPALGILRSYPLPIRAMPEGRSAMRNSGAPEPGADELARTLLTLPTHRFVSDTVVQRIARWAAS